MNGERNGTDETVNNLENPATEPIIGEQGEQGNRECLTGLASLPGDALVGHSALAGLLSVSARTLQRMINRGQIPKGVKLGGRRVWIAGKVRQYLNDEADRLAAEARSLSLRLVRGRM